MRWETKLSPDAVQYFFHGDPVIVGGAVVVPADRASGASIHGVERSSGKELWRHPAGRGVNGPLAADASRVYAAGIGGELLALDPGSGEVRWAVGLKVPGWEGPAAALDRVFAGTADGSLHGLAAATGREVWRVDLGAPVSTTVAASSGDLYVGTADGSIHRVDARSGRITGARKLDGSLVPKSVPLRTSDSLFVLLGDRSGDSRALVSLDPELGAVRWRVSASEPWSTSRVFVWGDLVVLGTPSGEVEGYCGKTGARVWSRSVKGRVRSVGGGGDVLLIGTPAGDLYALSALRTCGAD